MNYKIEDMKKTKHCVNSILSSFTTRKFLDLGSKFGYKWQKDQFQQVCNLTIWSKCFTSEFHTDRLSAYAT